VSHSICPIPQASIHTQGGQPARKQRPVDQAPAQAPPAEVEAAAQDGAATSPDGTHADSLHKQVEQANEVRHSASWVCKAGQLLMHLCALPPHSWVCPNAGRVPLAHALVQAAAGIRGQLKAEQQTHAETKAAFVAEVAARTALLQLLHSVAACLQRRLETSSGCSAPLQPATDISTSSSTAQRLLDAPGAATLPAAPQRCECSIPAARLRPRSSRAAAEPDHSRITAMANRQTLAPWGVPGGFRASTPGIMNTRISTPRRHGLPACVSRSAHELGNLVNPGGLTRQAQQMCREHRPTGCSSADAAGVQAAVVALCGSPHGAQQQGAVGCSAAAACAARLQVVQWLAEHAFGAERMTALHACQQAVDQV
jgi:hypothetical protein